MTDYEKISSFQNLYKAHIDLRKGKRNKPECIKFELDMANNLATMHEQLVNKDYKMRGYYHFQVHEPKKRDIFAAYYPDRVLLHCICNEVVKPLVGPRLIYDNAACQIGKGTHFAMRRLTKFMSEHYKNHGAAGYILKCDITKYFASIPHDILKQKLDKLLIDPDVKKLLFNFIDSHETEGCQKVGLPLGNHSSQWFAIYYLDRADRFIKETLRVKHYIRYMDDLLLLHHDKQFLKNALEQIKEVVEGELKLTLNAKTQITPIKNGVEFLGWRFYLSETGKVVKKLKPQTKLRFKRKLKQFQIDYAESKTDLEDIQNTLASYNGHLKHGHAYKLKSKALRNFVLRRSFLE